MTAPSNPAAPGNPAATAPEVATTTDLQTMALRGSWWTAVQAMIGLPLSFAVNLVVARELGPDGFGTVASYTAAYTLLVLVLNGGIPDATIQWGAAATARGDRAELLATFRRCAGFHLFYETPFAAVAGLVLLRHESVAVQVVGAISLALTLAFGTTAIALTAMSRNAGLAKLSLVLGVAVNLAVVTASLQTHAAGPTWVARIAVGMVGAAAPLFIAAPDVRRACFTPVLPRGWPDGFARYAVRTLTASLISTLVFSRSEVLLLDAYGRGVAAGVFALGAGVAGQITAPIDAILGPLIPAAASLVAVGRQRAAAAARRGMRLSALATLPLVLVVLPGVAAVIPVVYGHRFGATAQVFVLLGVVSCLQSVLHPVWAFAGALRLPLTILAINCAALAVDLVLSLVLIPTIGVFGAAIGNTVGQLISLGASLWLLRRHLGLGARAAARDLGPFVAGALSGAAGATLGVVLNDRGMGSVWTVTIAAIAVSAVIGTLAVRLCGGVVTAGDFATIVAAIPRAQKLQPAIHLLGWIRTDPAKTPDSALPDKLS